MSPWLSLRNCVSIVASLWLYLHDLTSEVMSPQLYHLLFWWFTCELCVSNMWARVKLAWAAPGRRKNHLRLTVIAERKFWLGNLLVLSQLDRISVIQYKCISYILASLIKIDLVCNYTRWYMTCTQHYKYWNSNISIRKHPRREAELEVGSSLGQALVFVSESPYFLSFFWSSSTCSKVGGNTFKSSRLLISCTWEGLAEASFRNLANTLFQLNPESVNFKLKEGCVMWPSNWAS